MHQTQCASDWLTFGDRTNKRVEFPFAEPFASERAATISQLAAAPSKPEAQAKELCVVLPSLAIQAWTLHVSGKPWANAQRPIYSQPLREPA